MATGVYSGISSVARKVKKLYFGSAGIAKQVKKGYIGVNGLARLFYSGRLVDAGPHRFDSNYKREYGYNGIIGPMDETTFARYGEDVTLSAPLSSYLAPAMTREYVAQSTGEAYYSRQDVAVFDPSNGSMLNHLTKSPYDTKRVFAGTQDYIVTDGWGSNYLGEKFNNVFDPISLSILRRFNVRYNADWKGGYNNNAFCYDAHQDDSANGGEYDLNTGTKTRTISYIGGNYIQHFREFDGLDGKLFVGSGTFTGIVDYSSLAYILSLGTNPPAYSGYSYRYFACFKP